MTELLPILDIAEAVKLMLTGHHDFVDATRRDAQSLIRNLTEDRVSARRRPQGDDRKTAITLVKPTVEPDPDFGSPGTCETTNLEVRIFSNKERESTLLWKAVSQMLSGLSAVTVTTQDGSLLIGATWIIEHGEPEAEEPIEGSDAWAFEYIGIFGISHQILAPTGNQ